MDPIERLRALRDDSRWVPGEVELSAAPRPARLWRHWWPRITVAAIACAALAGLVIATLVGVGHTTNFAPGPASTDSSTPVVSPSASPSPTHPPVAPTPASPEPPVPPVRDCDSSDLVASAPPAVGGATETLFTVVMLMNSGPGACEITAAPAVQWARASGSAVTPIGPSGEVAPDQSTQPRLTLQPGAIAYVRVTQNDVDPTDTDMVNECQPTPVYGIALTLPESGGVSSAIALPLSEVGFGEVSKGDGCGSATESFLSSLPAYLSPDLGTTSSEGVPNCTVGQLRASLDDPVSGAAGTSGVEIVLTNTSDSTCSLAGHAGVVFVGHGNGTQLGAPATPQVDVFSDVSLAPGKSAYEVVLISNPDNRSMASCRPVTPNGFQVTPPGGSSSLFVPFTRLRACTAGATQLTTRALTPTPSLPH